MGTKAMVSDMSDTGGVSSARPDLVFGRLPLRGAGTPSLGALIDFADELATAGIALSIAEGQTAGRTGCHASLFGPATGKELAGEAAALHRGETVMNWLVTIRDGGNCAVASIALSYALPPAASPAGLADEGETEAEEGPAAGAEMPTALAEKRRALIAEAAGTVIAQKGFANATMREIADAAGMHVPTMYQYVASKDEMLELVYNWAMARARTDVSEATVNCRTATEKLEATVTSLVEKGDRFRKDVGVLNREFKALSHDSRVRVLANYRKLLLQIGDLVREGVETGEFRDVDPEIAANFIEATCDMWALRQFAVGQFDRSFFAQQISELILSGLRGQPVPRREEGVPR